MKLALRELRRRPNRFAVATVILTLIALLLTFLGGLLDGLERGSTGALRLQDADAIVFAEGAEGSLVRSRIDEDVRGQVDAVVGGGARRRPRQRAARRATGRPRAARPGPHRAVRLRAGAEGPPRGAARRG